MASIGSQQLHAVNKQYDTDDVNRMNRLKNLYEQKFKKLRTICRESNSNIFIVSLNWLYYLANGKNIIAHQNTTIRGLKNISTRGRFKIGLDCTGFTHNKDVTYLNIDGKLEGLRQRFCWQRMQILCRQACTRYNW
jgi:hypothetical protein